MLRQALVSILVAAAALAGTAKAAAPVKFPHALHVEDNGVECTTCHLAQPLGPPKVSESACADCHSDGPPAYVFEPKARRLAVQFPHAKHDKARKCQECHAAIVKPEWTNGKAMFEERECEACHKANSVSVNMQSCSDCHGFDRRRAKPSSHTTLWPTRHGLTYDESATFAHGTDCRMCHGQDACVRCHATKTPKSHTGGWRLRMHGITAMYDRERCATCHLPSTCIQCHSTTRPLNHTATWNRVHGLAAQTETNEICLVCHRVSYCGQCHPSR